MVIMFVFVTGFVFGFAASIAARRCLNDSIKARRARMARKENNG